MKPLSAPLMPILLALCSLVACKPEPAVEAYDPGRDYFSYADPGRFRTRHLALDLDVDFAARQLRGSVVLHLEQIQAGVRELVLDSRGLNIGAAYLLGPGGAEKPLEFSLGEIDAVRGEALTVLLPEDFRPAGQFQVRIEYHTGPNATALMWLTPELTDSGQPFMFTQSQSIHARSWIPLQDTPAVRSSYEAVIRTPPGLLAVMSADNDPAAERDGEYGFTMPQPIPSYLMALAVGNLYFEPFGDRTGVYAEPEVLARAAWEFADTQAMLESAEARYGAYQWGRYDLLILPNSFPFGGMENPRLSFITPSVLAGDRSLVSLIAHELAHSWSGNLVSNRTWRDIWLNEGTTSYLDLRLMEELYGKERADEERLLSYQSLVEELSSVPADMQALAPVFQSGDPDVGQDGIEYSKGQLLLETLEEKFGREIFDDYMAGYFRNFQFQAISSEQFLEYLDRELLQRHPGIYARSEVEKWLYQPGIPDTAVKPRSSSLDQAAAFARGWAMGERATDTLPHQNWSPQGQVYFIKALPGEVSSAQLAELDQALGLSVSLNPEITRAWFTLVAERRHEPAYEAMAQHLRRNGRARLLEPVYKALAGNGQDAALAREIFESARAGYHPYTVETIERVLVSPSPVSQ